MVNKPCRSYCKHGGVCILEADHKEKHNSRYCTWTDEEGLTKEKAHKIIIEKNGDLGRAIVGIRTMLLNKLDANTGEENDNSKNKET